MEFELILNESVPVMILGNIQRQNGGVTHAVYRRANALSESHRFVVIITTGFQRDFWELVQWHKDAGNLRKNVIVWNLYESTASSALKPRPHWKNPKWSYFKDRRKLNACRVFDEEGRYLRYEELNDDGTLNFVDHFEAPWKRVKKSYYDRTGQVRLEKYMDDDNSPSFQVIFDSSGNPLVSSRLADSGRPLNYFSHWNNVEYSDEMHMVADWLSGTLQKFENPVLFIEKREHVSQLAKVDHDSIKRIFVLHSSHLDYPFSNSRNISKTMFDAFDEIKSGRIDKMVVLTDEQKNDLAIEPSVFERTVVIPHYQERPVLRPIERDPYLIVSLARYHHSKNLDASIDIFATALDRIPELVYEIYGYGPERARLQQLIDSRGLTGKVVLCGHTDEPEVQLSRARLSLLTSRHEGFGLAVSESLALGTPVVSFDAKYGPGSIIEHGCNGFLVREGDRINLASDYIERLVLDNQLWESMHKASESVTVRFSRKRFVDAWAALLKSS